MTWEQVGENQGIWTEYQNSETKERSLKTHTLKVVKQWCPKGQHDYLITDGKKYLAVCSMCDHEANFVPGRDKIDGDKVIIG